MKNLLLTFTVLFSLCCSNAAWSLEDPERPKVGLVLSGGGARGGAHVGVLKALEEIGIPIDYIAGTSMGAIIGGFYAAGYSAAEIEELLKTTDWNRALTDRPDRRDRTMRKKEIESDFLIPYRLGYNQGRLQAALGAVEGQHLDQLFQRILMPVSDIRRFDDLPIPFRAVATDLASGEAVVLERGSLADALRASMSVPGAFTPVRLEGRLLVDGGMSNNLPVSVARDMGADIVIAVDISSPLLEEEQLTSVLSVTEQLTNFLTRRTTQQQIETLGEQDILIVPDLGDFGAADFENAEDIIPRGEEATLAERGRLASLADGLPHPGLAEARSGEYLVQFVDIHNESVLNEAIIRSRLAVAAGEPLNVDALERSLDEIYSLDVFESVTYDLVDNESGEEGILITALPRRWGPNYLQFGLELSNDFSGSSDFKLGAAYTRNALNSLGGEMRVLTSMGREDEINFNYYQPVDLEARWFVNPEVRWKRQNLTIWNEDVRAVEFELSGWKASLGAGRNFGTTDEVRLTYRFGRTDGDLLIGVLPPLADDRIEIGELELSYVHDGLDSLYFPTKGSNHGVYYRYADDSLGSEFDYKQAAAAGSFVFSRGRNTGLMNYELGYSFDDEVVPASSWYQLGGLGRLSGLAPNQLIGPHAGLLTVAYYRRLNDIRFFPAYAGVTLEAGNVWGSKDDIGFDDLRYSGSLFIGAESPLGPLYFAVGYSDSGDAAAYFYLGNPFRANRIE